MTDLSLLDKMKILLQTTKSSKLFIVLIIFLIFFAYILFTTNKKNKKTSKSIFALVYTFIFLFIIILYHSSLGKMFDYLMNNVFVLIYFPNLAVYLTAIIITNIIVLISVFNFKTTKFIKNLNISIYIILNYLLALILSVIAKEKLDVFTTSSVYGNKNALGLIELSSTIFIIWIIFLVVYKIFLYYVRKDYKQPKKIVVRKSVKKLPPHITETSAPSINKEYRPKNVLETANIINSKEVAEIENTLTLEDYRTVLRILKEGRSNSNEESSLSTKLNNKLNKEDFYIEPEIIATKTISSTNLFNEEKEETKKEQSIFDELMQLYNN